MIIHLSLPLSKKEMKKVRLSLLMDEEQNNENKKAPTMHTNSMTNINTQTLNSRQKRLKRSAIQSDWIVMISEVPTGGSAGGKPRLPVSCSRSAGALVITALAQKADYFRCWRKCPRFTTEQSRHDGKLRKEISFA